MYNEIVKRLVSEKLPNQDFLEPEKIIRKPPITAIQRWSGTGIGNIKTLSFGLITASVPPKANIAPDAPTAMEKGGARSMKKILPKIPPQK